MTASDGSNSTSDSFDLSVTPVNDGPTGLDLDSSFDAGEIRQTDMDGGTLVEMNVDGDAKAEMAIFLKGFHGSLGDGDVVL